MTIVHNLNVGCADCSMIIGTSATYLVDCGSLERYPELLPSSKRLRGVFITHQHTDHFEGLEYLRRNKYTIDFLIYSPYERRVGDSSVGLEEWNEFKSHRDYFEKQGTGLRAPYRQENWANPWWGDKTATFWIVGPGRAIATSAVRELHDACLVIHAKVGSRRFLFAGDGSDKNLQNVSESVENYCRDILHASHHGSLDGSCLDFVKKAAAKYTVISTQAGVHENVPHPTALRRYENHTAEKVYRTDFDGSLKWSC